MRTYVWAHARLRVCDVRIYMQSVCGSVFMGMAFVETVFQCVSPGLGGRVLTDHQGVMPGSLHEHTLSLGIFQAMTTWWCLSPRPLRSTALGWSLAHLSCSGILDKLLGLSEPQCSLSSLGSFTG